MSKMSYYNRYKKHSANKVLLDFGTWEMTAREVIFGLLLFAIYIIGGLCIYEKIDRKIEDHNAKYNSAVWVTDDETFANRIYSDSRDAFVYGDWSSVGYVTFNDIQSPEKPAGQYSWVKCEKEHYTRHTRRVAHTRTVNGKSSTYYTTEVYYTWDHVWTHFTNVAKIKFAGLIFPYGTVEPTGIGVYLGTNTHGNDRYVYHAEKTEASGIAFTHIEDNGIQRCTLYTQYKNTPEDFQAFLDRELMGNAARYAFWITFILLGLFGVIMFCYLDNDWLNNL